MLSGDQRTAQQQTGSQSRRRFMGISWGARRPTTAEGEGRRQLGTLSRVYADDDRRLLSLTVTDCDNVTLPLPLIY
jgi:hypothetical protein